MSLSETSNVAATPALQGQNTAAGDGVRGDSASGEAVVGVSQSGRGVHGISQSWHGVYGESQTSAGVVGEATKFHGIFGVSHDINSGGVYGTNDAKGFGLIGVCPGGRGVQGDSTNGEAVVGVSQSGRGVHGISQTGQAIYGESQTQPGVVGEAWKFHGIFGVSHDVNSAGVYAHNDAGGSGVVGISEQGAGIIGITNNSNAAAISGQNTGNGLAGNFQGNVNCTGDLSCGGDITLTGGDCAEEFQLSADSAAEPGAVMIMNESGEATPSSSAYDRRVIGVVSGAGDLKPAIILDRKHGANRATIALVGKVYCKVDASSAPIRVGDLLTTSCRPGHAMKVQEENRAFGAVIGKALRSIDEGCAMIPVLITLQ